MCISMHRTCFSSALIRGREEQRWVATDWDRLTFLFMTSLALGQLFLIKLDKLLCIPFSYLNIICVVSLSFLGIQSSQLYNEGTKLGCCFFNFFRSCAAFRPSAKSIQYSQCCSSKMFLCTNSSFYKETLCLYREWQMVSDKKINITQQIILPAYHLRSLHVPPEGKQPIHGSQWFFSGFNKLVCYLCSFN